MSTSLVDLYIDLILGHVARVLAIAGTASLIAGPVTEPMWTVPPWPVLRSVISWPAVLSSSDWLGDVQH